MTDLKTLEEQDKKLTREEHIVNYIKQLNTIEQAIKPYRDWETDRKSTRLNSSH